MSTFDHLAGLAAAPQTEEAGEAADGQTQPLTEMMGYGMSKRYLNPRDLQYSLEDAKTTCQRMWTEKQRYKEDAEGLEAAHNKLQKALQAAGEAAKAYADAQDSKHRM